MLTCNTLVRLSLVAILSMVLAVFAAESAHATPWKYVNGSTSSGFNQWSGNYDYSFDGGFGSSTGYMYEYPPYTTSPTLGVPIVFTGAGGNTSTARSGVSFYGDSESVTGYLAPGVLVSQYAPGGGDYSAATLKLRFGVCGYSYRSTLDSMLDPIAWYNLPLVATIADTGYVDVTLQTTIHGEAAGGQDFFVTEPAEVWSTPVSATETLSGTFAFPDLVGANDSNGLQYQFSVHCELTIAVKNDSGEVGISMPEGLTYGMQGTVSSVPEPSTLILLVAGAIGLFAYAGRRQR